MPRRGLVDQAHELLEEIRSWHNGKSGVFSAQESRVFELLSGLRGKKLLAERNVKGTYVVRDRMHGGPLLLDPRNSEICFASLRFAQACRKLYPHVFETGSDKTKPHILKIIE